MVKEIVRDVEILSKKSEKFIFKQDESLIQDMFDTAYAHANNCAGLAAVQIGIHKRVILVWDGNKFVPFINPVIVKRSSEIYMIQEGCLSLDGLRTVLRHRYITVMYSERNGKIKKQTFVGYMAQIIQHECDHLDGILI